VSADGERRGGKKGIASAGRCNKYSRGFFVEGKRERSCGPLLTVRLRYHNAFLLGREKKKEEKEGKWSDTLTSVYWIFIVHVYGDDYYFSSFRARKKGGGEKKERTKISLTDHSGGRRHEGGDIRVWYRVPEGRGGEEKEGWKVQLCREPPHQLLLPKKAPFALFQPPSKKEGKGGKGKGKKGEGCS